MNWIQIIQMSFENCDLLTYLLTNLQQRVKFRNEEDSISEFNTWKVNIVILIWE